MKYLLTLFWGFLIFEAESQKTSSAGKLSVETLQKEIFTPRCAIPACHDGSFEPDFRTAESSYNTLVYHPVTKNNSTSGFKYRVIPGKPESSILYERITNCCFVNQNDRMPFTVGDTLETDKISMIKKWILDGAIGQLGTVYSHPPDQIYFSERYFVRGNDSINLNGEAFHVDGVYPKPLLVTTNIQDLTFTFQITNKAVPDSSIYTLGLFKDKDYRIQLASYPLYKDSIVFNCIVQTKELANTDPVFLQLKVERQDRNYLYPNLFTPYYQRLHWSFVKGIRP